jgi:hypothetical protein
MSNEDMGATGVPEPPFTMADYHKKALITLLHAFHNNRQSLTYPELSRRLDVNEKTKAWQCVAWKDLRSNDYIVSSSKDKKQWELSEDKGVALASTLVSPEEMAEYQVPDTAEKLHEQIKKRLMKLTKGGKMGVKIFDLMLSDDYIPLGRNDLAAKFGTLADSHAFFYGLKSLKDWGYAVFCDEAEIADLKRRSPAAASTTDSDEEEEEEELVPEEETETKPPKKKQRKSKKKRSGGKPLKLSETTFLKSA